ncbi:MAG TPA: ribonuclease E/G [Stellaceae bacterium]|jgi:ribonuclease G|nr:ribonuclease E/G [Stellaceae bacterium]
MAELLIAIGPGEWRAAWVEDGEARELYVERGDTKPPGSRHLGRVVRVVPALDAALVDIGDERPGFLPLRDAPRNATVSEGAAVVVEVRREAWQDKAPRLSGKLPDAAVLPAELRPPAQLLPAPGLAAALALRLPMAPAGIEVDDVAAVAELRRVFTDVEIDVRHGDEWPIELDALFEAALSPSLAIGEGGSLHIEETHAATMIDVDTGSPAGRSSSARAALAANRAAARLVAQELRRRNIGGAVVIDFVGLERRDHRDQVLATLTGAMAHDPAKPQVLGWTRLGHLELTRPRRARSLADAMLEPTGRRKQPVALAYEALKRLQREARMMPAATWRLRVAPAVAMTLHDTAAPALRTLETRLGRAIAIESIDGLDGFDIAPG